MAELKLRARLGALAARMLDETEAGLADGSMTLDQAGMNAWFFAPIIAVAEPLEARAGDKAALAGQVTPPNAPAPAARPAAGAPPQPVLSLQPVPKAEEGA